MKALVPRPTRPRRNQKTRAGCRRAQFVESHFAKLQHSCTDVKHARYGRPETGAGDHIAIVVPWYRQEQCRKPVRGVAALETGPGVVAPPHSTTVEAVNFGSAPVEPAARRARPAVWRPAQPPRRNVDEVEGWLEGAAAVPIPGSDSLRADACGACYRYEHPTRLALRLLSSWCTIIPEATRHRRVPTLR